MVEIWWVCVYCVKGIIILCGIVGDMIFEKGAAV